MKGDGTVEYTFKLPRDVSFLLNRLFHKGYRADIVGGCVRDSLLEAEPNDYDLTTSASPEEIKDAFFDMRTVDTGIKHGTVTVLVNHIPYEVTTYRVDGAYTDNRHPDSVTFTRKIEDDLARRDFTVNAMAYNERDGLTDLFSGREDLERGIIRAVGEPEKRFTEDALRILRALRFASTLDFKIEEQTALGLRKTAPLLKNVSAERIFTEWNKLLSGNGAYRIIKEYFDVIKLIIPELSDISLPSEEAFKELSPELRELLLFAMIKDNLPSESYLAAMERLKSDSKRRRLGKAVLENLGEKALNQRDVHFLLIKTDPETAEGVIRLLISLGKTDEAALMHLCDILEKKLPYKVSHLAVNGNDLLKLGIEGRVVGKLLDLLLVYVASGMVSNERDALLGNAKIRLGISDKEESK